MIQNGKLTVATVIGAALLTTGFVLMTSPIEGNQAAAAYPMDQRGDHGYGYSHGKMKPGGYAAGTIASIQNDESGNPAWVLSGYWKASLTEGEAGNQSSPASNSTSVMGEDMSNKVGKFGATFDMVMTNGSASHQHQIDNFTLTGMSTPDNRHSIVHDSKQHWTVCHSARVRF